MANNKSRQITTPSPNVEKLDSQWGRISYIEWCEKESRRINRAGGNAVVSEFKDSHGVEHCCVARP